MSRIGSSALLATFGLGTGLELGQATTFSFVGVVIALYLVRKSSELFGLDIRIELDVDGALPFPIAPGLAWSALLHARWWAEQGAYFALALAGAAVSGVAVATAGSAMVGLVRAVAARGAAAAGFGEANGSEFTSRLKSLCALRAT
jgi:hypothetical protein